jgi:hypothetical protein
MERTLVIKDSSICYIVKNKDTPSEIVYTIFTLTPFPFEPVHEFLYPHDLLFPAISISNCYLPLIIVLRLDTDGVRDSGLISSLIAFSDSSRFIIFTDKVF